METRAIARHVRIAPRKARLVADLVRGKLVAEALTILKFTPRKGSRLISKTLRSAVANAENTRMMDVDNLFIKAIYVDDGPRMKRWQPRAMGRATRLLKRTSHVTVIVAEK
jgi:large subunit ribosomal protein L22